MFLKVRESILLTILSAVPFTVSSPILSEWIRKWVSNFLTTELIHFIEQWFSIGDGRGNIKITHALFLKHAFPPPPSEMSSTYLPFEIPDNCSKTLVLLMCQCSMSKSSIFTAVTGEGFGETLPSKMSTADWTEACLDRCNWLKNSYPGREKGRNGLSKDP